MTFKIQILFIKATLFISKPYSVFITYALTKYQIHFKPLGSRACGAKAGHVKHHAHCIAVITAKTSQNHELKGFKHIGKVSSTSTYRREGEGGKIK